MTVQQELFEILACPVCRGALEMAPDRESVLCRACSLRYLMNGGSLDMRPGHAVPRENQEEGR
jgi:uncharacterized protein YbaR (Trm112 family)